jgi:hypothetical protein
MTACEEDEEEEDFFFFFSSLALDDCAKTAPSLGLSLGLSSGLSFRLYLGLSLGLSLGPSLELFFPFAISYLGPGWPAGYSRSMELGIPSCQ